MSVNETKMLTAAWEDVRDGEWRARRKAEHEAEMARRAPIYKGILLALEQLISEDEVIEFTSEHNKIWLVNKASKLKTDLSWFISIDERFPTSNRRYYVGRLKAREGYLAVVTGNFGERKSFRPLKAGGYNYRAIAEEVLWAGRREIGKKFMERTRKSNDVIRKEFAEEMRLDSTDYYSSVRASADVNKPLMFVFKVEKAYEPEELKAIIEGLRALGLEVK